MADQNPQQQQRGVFSLATLEDRGYFKWAFGGSDISSADGVYKLRGLLGIIADSLTSVGSAAIAVRQGSITMVVGDMRNDVQVDNVCSACLSFKDFYVATFANSVATVYICSFEGTLTPIFSQQCHGARLYTGRGESVLLCLSKIGGDDVYVISGNVCQLRAETRNVSSAGWDGKKWHVYIGITTSSNPIILSIGDTVTWSDHEGASAVRPDGLVQFDSLSYAI